MRRIYETNMEVEAVRDAKEKEVKENRNELRLANTEKTKLFSFSLSQFPGNKLQLSSVNNFLQIHKLKPYVFLQDLRILRKLTEVLGKPMDFKLHEEIPQSSKDVAEMEEATQMFIRYLLKSKVRREMQLIPYWKAIRESEEARSEFAETMNNAMAGSLCMAGIRCFPDGLFRPLGVDPAYQRFPGLLAYENSLAKFLLKCGFL